MAARFRINCGQMSRIRLEKSIELAWFVIDVDLGDLCQLYGLTNQDSLLRLENKDIILLCSHNHKFLVVAAKDNAIDFNFNRVLNVVVW